MKLSNTTESESSATPFAAQLTQAQRDKPSLDSQVETAGGIQSVHRDWTIAARTTGDLPPDLIVSAKDAINFNVHRDRILGASVNGFNGRLSSPLRQGSEDGAVNIKRTIELPYSSTVVNLLLKEVYNEGGRSRSQESLTDLSSAILALKEYGIPLETSVSESSMLFGMLSSHCQHSALDVYVLAASHAPDLHHLATHASSFLLSVEFPKITDEKVVIMGPIYLRQLYMLLSERTREFKQLLLPLPQFHAPTQQCDTKALKEAWRAAIGDLVQCAAPDVQGAVIDSTKYSVINRVPLACDGCKASLEQRFEHLKHAWSLVKSTI